MVVVLVSLVLRRPIRSGQEIEKVVLSNVNFPTTRPAPPSVRSEALTKPTADCVRMKLKPLRDICHAEQDNRIAVDSSPSFVKGQGQPLYFTRCTLLL